MRPRRTIYALCDPRLTGIPAVRYVGSTMGLPEDRLAAHEAEARRGGTRAVQQWIRELALLGERPIILILQENATWTHERAWIMAFDSLGALLVNGTEPRCDRYDRFEPLIAEAQGLAAELFNFNLKN